MILEIANETGSSGHKHAHVMFQLHKKWDSSDPRCFDYCGEHPNIKPLLGRYAMIDTAKYLAKDDPENKDLVQRTTDFIMELNKNSNRFNIQPVPVAPTGEEQKNMSKSEIATICSEINTIKKQNRIVNIWNANTIQDAIFDSKPSFTEVPGLIQLYNLKPFKFEVPEQLIPKHKWQWQIMEEFAEPVKSDHEYRRITWIVDPIGNSGKTQLGKFLTCTEHNKWINLKDFGRSCDASTIISNAIDSGWTAHGAIIDLPRTYSEREGMYQPLENIKDGMITTTKYSGKTICFPTGHLIVFANWLPKFHMLSRDRWDCRVMVHKNDDIILEHYNSSVHDEFIISHSEKDI